nr:Chain C, GAG PEPTIDE [synthetic construct]
SLYLTVATL